MTRSGQIELDLGLNQIQDASKEVVALFNSTSDHILIYSHAIPSKVDTCHVVNIETSHSVIPRILAATCLPSQIDWSTTAGSFKTLMPSAGAVSKENLGFSLGPGCHNF